MAETTETLRCQHQLTRESEFCRHGFHMGTTCEPCIRTCPQCWDGYSSASDYGSRPSETPETLRARAERYLGYESQQRDHYSGCIELIRDLLAALTTVHEERAREAIRVQTLREQVASVHEMLAELDDVQAKAEQRANAAEQERDVLRGVGCLIDGDGPCGICIKCLRARADAAEALVETRTQVLRRLAGRIEHAKGCYRIATGECYCDKEEIDALIAKLPDEPTAQTAAERDQTRRQDFEAGYWARERKGMLNPGGTPDKAFAAYLQRPPDPPQEKT